MMILFVCTGNTCRSVMAEALMRRLWERDGDGSELKIVSAGLAPIENRASSHARELLSREGISLEDHIPRHLTPAQIREARLILVMEEHHRRAVLDLYPAVEEKIYLLKEFVGIKDGAPGVKDPYGGSEKIYSRTLEEIREAVKKLIEKLAGDDDFNAGKEASDR